MSIYDSDYESNDEINDKIVNNFMEICQEKDLEKVKIFYDEYSEVINNNYIDIFYDLCEDPSLFKISKWFYELPLIEFSDTFLDEIFEMACSNSYTSDNSNETDSRELIEWIYSIHTNMNEVTKYTGFKNLCSSGHLSLAQFIYSKGLDTYILQSQLVEEIYECIACTEHINIFKWWYTLYPEFNLLNNDNELFKLCIKSNHIEIAEFILEKYPEIKDTLNIWFQQNMYHLYSFVNIEIIQWIYSNFSLSLIIDRIGFIRLCEMKRLKIVQWIYSLKPIKIKDDKYLQLLHRACISGYIEMFEWLFKIKRMKYIDLSYYFQKACEWGHLNIAQWIYQKNNNVVFSWEEETTNDIVDEITNETMTETTTINTNVFIKACLNGRLNVAIWLYSIYSSQINISEFDELVFRNACEKNYLEMAQWLLSVKPDIDICAVENYAISYACTNGHLKMAKWIVSVKPDIDLRQENDILFGIVCREGKIKVAKWLLSICLEIDICAENDYAFKKACEKKRLKIVKWLVSLKPERYSYVLEDKEREEGQEYDTFTILYKINENNTFLSKEMEESKIIDCSICFEKSNMITSCSHQFCESCIKECIKNTNICPYCRTTLFYENIFTIKHK